jgi:hypothetical protein
VGGIRQHLRSNVVGYIALFFALSTGSAVALSGSNTVQSDDLGPGAPVKAVDVAANAVNGSNVLDNSISGADLAPSALPKGRATTSSCHPNSSTFVDCGFVTINLARTSRVLIVTDAMWHSTSAGVTAGECRIGVDGGPFGPNVFPGEDTDNSSGGTEQTVSLTNVTDPLPPGSHTFGLACREQAGTIGFDETFISAVLLGSA